MDNDANTPRILMKEPPAAHRSFWGRYEDIPTLSARLSALIPPGRTFAECIWSPTLLTVAERRELWEINERIIVRRYYALSERGKRLHPGGIALPIPECPQPADVASNTEQVLR